LVLERVDPQDEARLRTFVQASASGFLAQGQPAPEEWMATGLAFARRPGTDSYLALVDGVVAGGAGCSTRQNLVSLFGTSVLPAFRRRGIQLALMIARLERGRALGADLADITSRPGIPTERNATRLGFQLGYVRVVLVKPGPGLAPSP
jgi:GNAT superfamily N-acetyltransferase